MTKGLSYKPGGIYLTKGHPKLTGFKAQFGGDEYMVWMRPDGKGIDSFEHMDDYIRKLKNTKPIIINSLELGA